MATEEEAQEGRNDIRGSRLNNLEKDDQVYRFFSPDDDAKVNFKVKKVKSKEANENVITLRVIPIKESQSSDDGEETMTSENECGEQSDIDEVKIEAGETDIEEDEEGTAIRGVQYKEVVIPITLPSNFMKSPQKLPTTSGNQIPVQKIQFEEDILTGLNQLGEPSHGNVVFLEQVGGESPEKNIVAYEEVIGSFPPTVAQEEMVYTDSQSEYVDIANTVTVPSNAVVMFNGKMIGKLT